MKKVRWRSECVALNPNNSWSESAIFVGSIRFPTFPAECSIRHTCAITYLISESICHARDSFWAIETDLWTLLKRKIDILCTHKGRFPHVTCLIVISVWQTRSVIFSKSGKGSQICDTKPWSSRLNWNSVPVSLQKKKNWFCLFSWKNVISLTNSALVWTRRKTRFYHDNGMHGQLGIGIVKTWFYLTAI